MNTPTKRIFYLFGPKFAKNEPQTKVWGSLTCKSQFLRLAESVSCAFAELRSRLRALALFALVAHVRAGRSQFRTRSRRSRPVARAFALVARIRAT